MPKRLEEKLWRTARRRGYGPKRTRRYVYGTMQELGLLHRHARRVRKGRRR